MSPHRRPIEVRVVPRNLRWEVEVDGATRRMIDWLCTKERAIDLLRWEGAATAVVIVMRADWTEEGRFEVTRCERISA